MKALSDSDSLRASLVAVDFNSEDAFCDDLSDEEGPPEVKILGMELLLLDEEEVPSDFVDDSETDSSDDEVEHQMKRTVYSLELARKRLPHLVVRGCKRAMKRRKHRKLYEDIFPGGEVDSLVLTRERVPHLIHQPDNVARLRQLYEQGKGLFGEVDSLVLDKKRLPHLIHKREAYKESEKYRSLKSTTGKEVFAELLAEMEDTEIGGDLGSDHVEFMKLSGESDDSASTTESSASSSDTLFSSETVDSLILTRRRLAAHSPRRHQTISCEKDKSDPKPPMAAAKLSPKSGVGLSFGLCRTSSGACAA